MAGDEITLVPMEQTAQEAAELIREHRDDAILVISHMDADGISAAAIISIALDRLKIRHHVKFVRMLYRDVVNELVPGDLTIFTDLGSSQLGVLKEKFSGHDVIISDHHKPDEGHEWPRLVHLNAHLCGLDGAQEISGAGMTYIIARRLNPENVDLSALAIVGAVGDVQNAWGKLKGYNRRILKESMEAGVLDCKKDLLFYGRHTRPLTKALESFSDPPIPGVTNSIEGCVSLLKELGIPYRTENGWRRPVDLTEEEKRKLATELIMRAMTDVPEELVAYVPGLIIGEVHTLTREREMSPLRDADGFSTCLNASARHEQPIIGFEVAKGDREVYYRAMLNLLKHHRRSIAEGIRFVEQRGLKVGPKGYLQYFDATGGLKEMLTGTVAGMILSRRECDPYRPIAGIVRNGGVAKISARCSKLLFLRGLDLAGAIRAAAESVGGEGGGHAVACGAQVSEKKIPEFLKEFERRLLDQV